MLVEILILLHVEVLNDGRVAYAEASSVSDEEYDCCKALSRLGRVKHMSHDVEIVSHLVRFYHGLHALHNVA